MEAREREERERRGGPENRRDIVNTTHQEDTTRQREYDKELSDNKLCELDEREWHSSEATSSQRY
jgi:hypothetical protein